MKKLLAVLLVGVAMVGCSNNEGSANANASAAQANASAAQANASAAQQAAPVPVEASAPDASAAK
ncbi:MAG: hypothetical protein K0R94_808 [Burkholderiales bacterium]|jgi:uncharacterized protein YcfL|nr:hypothetical protein [Burkholderiales bacterium]